MVKVDLITGFLGSGKTTFIRKYVQYLLDQGEKICILENDHGAINVDMMLLSDLKSDRLGIEMVAGGCDYDCHRRRFKTKLITMAMLGYNRVIIEPSGVFDVDEFYDILNEDPLYDRYQISNVIAIVSSELEKELSESANFLLGSQVATAGCLLISRVDSSQPRSNYEPVVNHINQSLTQIKCHRQYDFNNDKEVIVKDWNDFTVDDFKVIASSGYHPTGYEKNFTMDDSGIESLFYMHLHMPLEECKEKITQVFADSAVGSVMRIKGFMQDEDEKWYEINATKDAVAVTPIAEGQDALIVIGEKMNHEKLEEYFPSKYNTDKTI